MHRRDFLTSCGLVAVGNLLFPAWLPGGRLHAAGITAASSAQTTDADRVLLRLLAAYGTDAYFWGSNVFARATGLNADGAATNLLVRVDDLSKLTAFLGSKKRRKLGVIRSAGNTLSFAFRGTAYTVTNELAADFSRSVAGGGVAAGRATATVFTHQRLLYHPATDMLSDPQFALAAKHLELAETPSGGIKARFQTVLQGWLESRQHNLKPGKKFVAFQQDLLGAKPTAKAAPKVVSALLEAISSLAASFSIDDLKPLLLSPLVSESLQSEFGLSGQEVLDQVATLRAELAAGDYPDAALWLAALLGSQIKDGTADQWFDRSAVEDVASAAATSAALKSARQLVEARR